MGLILDSGAISTLNNKDKYGYTALHTCASTTGKDSVSCLNLLCRYGADISKVEKKNKYTALGLAVKEGYHDSVVALLQNGANPEDKYKGKSFFFYHISL